MNIGIIGAGAIGTAIARALARNGIKARIANSRGAAGLDVLAAELPGITPASVQDASRADMVFIAVPWSKIPGAVKDLGPWDSRIVVDTNNPIEAPTFHPFELGGRASTEVVTDLVPGARVVKAFNHLQPSLVAGAPNAEGGRRVMFVSGADAAANAEVAELIDRLGFFALTLGGVEAGRLHEFPGGPLPTLNLVKFG